MNRKLHCLIADREKNVAEMVAWTWAKTDRHIDIIDLQLGWAYKQWNDNAMEILEEFRRQVVTARWIKIELEDDAEEKRKPRRTRKK
ncbi:MAG: hypothetical protein ACRC46_15475 [Thermoguttaceae bacterium]